MHVLTLGTDNSFCYPACILFSCFQSSAYTCFGALKSSFVPLKHTPVSFFYNLKNARAEDLAEVVERLPSKYKSQYCPSNAVFKLPSI
jgi:hypothetical protein